MRHNKKNQKKSKAERQREHRINAASASITVILLPLPMVGYCVCVYFLFQPFGHTAFSFLGIIGTFCLSNEFHSVWFQNIVISKTISNRHKERNKQENSKKYKCRCNKCQSRPVFFCHFFSGCFHRKPSFLLISEIQPVKRKFVIRLYNSNSGKMSAWFFSILICSRI